GGLVGGLTGWLYERAYFPWARLETFRAGEADPGTVLDLGRVTLVGGSFLPSVLGVDRIPTRPSAAALAALAVLLLGGLSVALAAVRDWRELRWVVGLRRAPNKGATLLWGVFLTNLVLVTFTPRGAGGTRYLIALYSVLPCWLGMLMARLVRHRRATGAAALALWLGFQAWANWTDPLG